jgi:uncharacterized membrane protein YcaP (DUF421 family)
MTILPATAARCGLAYVFLLILVRMSGKRAIRQGTPMDFVTCLILGELVDKLLTGRVPFSQYAVASTVVLLSHIGVKILIQHSSLAAGWLAGREQPIVERGQLVERGMRPERMNARSVFAGLRLRGTRDLREIKAADLEINGKLSALPEDWARDAQRQDADRARKKARRS